MKKEQMNFVGNAASKERHTALVAVCRVGRKLGNEWSGAAVPGSPARLSAVAAPQGSGSAAPAAALAAHGRGAPGGVPGPAGSCASSGMAARAESGAGPGWRSAERSCGAAVVCKVLRAAVSRRGSLGCRLHASSCRKRYASNPAPSLKQSTARYARSQNGALFVLGGAENHRCPSLNQTSRREVSVQSEAVTRDRCLPPRAVQLSAFSPLLRQKWSSRRSPSRRAPAAAAARAPARGSVRERGKKLSRALRGVLLREDRGRGSAAALAGSRCWKRAPNQPIVTGGCSSPDVSFVGIGEEKPKFAGL